MLDFVLIKNILIVAIGASIISTALIQKIKEMLTDKKWLFGVSLVVSLATGFLFSYCFSDLNWVSSIWVGVATWVGADAIYKSFEDKIFKPFSKMQEVVEIPKEQIKTLEEIRNEVQ